MRSAFITDEKLGHSGNNLNVVRLIFASTVIYSHAYYPRENYDALMWLMGSPLSWFAVDGFFVISGFLVYRSLERGRSARDYAISRFARIWPGLTVMAITVAVMYSLFSTFTPAQYFTSPKTISFVAGAAVFQPTYVLPGIVCGDHLCNVNGSLWTIPWEIKCYIALGVIFLFGRIFKSDNAINGAILITTALSITASIPQVRDVLVNAVGTKVYFIDNVSRLWFAFMCGVAAYKYRNRLPLLWPAAIALLALSAIAQFTPFAQPVRIVAAGYLALCAGFRSGSWSSSWGDYSFGMYIYAMPVMMTLILAGVHLSPMPLAALVTICTAPLAWASWHFVESPALTLRKRVRSRRKAKGTEPWQHPDVSISPEVR